ncbi:family 16 glycoside hydrolase [Planctomicrobium sp. SH668]|uniref:family 16 glycoside hydrolase n=1 Tax=Planctomicrobium sp. SH668 TaxID=3448126 RepID=UPI003F5C0614
MLSRSTLFVSALGFLSLNPCHVFAEGIVQTKAVSNVNRVEELPLIQQAHGLSDSNAKPFTSMVSASDLSGWTVHEGKEGTWKCVDGVISCSSPSGGWLRTNSIYSDFVVRLEYKLQPGGNSGIGIRVPDKGNPTFTAIEIQLLDDSSGKYKDLRADQYTGSVYYQAAPTRPAKLNANGEWNQCEIRCVGELLTISINGEVINQVDLAKKDEVKSDDSVANKLSQRPPMGYLALQSHSTPIEFRKIEIQDLTEKTASGLGYVDLVVGEGDPVGDATEVKLHYVGQLEDGRRFDDSRALGTPIDVKLNETIFGFSEGIRGMRVNGKRRLIVPAHLAYGTEGVPDAIPANATLVMEVELVGVQK